MSSMSVEISLDKMQEKIKISTCQIPLNLINRILRESH